MFGSGTSGGFGGFGANNNQSTSQSGSVFGSGGGFGQTPTNTGTGFGTGGGFGTSTSNAFGSSSTPNTGFGSGGGFGSSNSTFGAKPAFGSGTTGGGGLFGSNNNNASSTGGGFGFNNNQASTTPAFGASNTSGGGLFGSKPSGFGGSTTASTGGGLFGTAGPSNTGGAFGSSATTNTTPAIGFGGNNAVQVPLQGTATVAYEPYQEKEGNTTAMNHFQTIAHMPAYRSFSLEELRLQDYLQGRRYGNSSGQSGAFGFGSGFGGNTATTNTATAGFGSNTGATGGGLFGSNNNQASSGFGSTGGAFGSNTNTSTGGGLFGAKPATTGGLFGSTPSTTAGGGLFGSANNANTGGAFGTNTATPGFGATNTGNTGAGLFGNNNNQSQAKPGFSFGNTPATGGATFGNTGSTGFGTTTNTGGGLFGNNNNSNQQPATTGFGATSTGTGAFGASATTTGAFGANTAQQPGSGFGGGFGTQQQNQQKAPFGGFGAPAATTPTTGLFGNTQQPQQQQQGGLFGNKPAFGTTVPATGTSGGLFGNNTATQSTGGGLFGNNAATSNTASGGLFGNAAANNTNTGGGLFGTAPKPGGLFGNSTTTPTQTQPGGLFGNTLGNSTTQPTLGGSLFGSAPQQQQPPTGNLLGGSLFGSQQNQQQQQQQQAFSTSVADSPYGNSLLSSMGSQQNSPLGPIATPVGSQTKKAAMIPHHKIAPRNPTLTPRLGGSYSRTGSPFAASSAGNTSLGAGGSLGRSFASNNKLNLFESDDSVLSPGAFTPGSSSRVAGLKKLVIDKKIRDQDLFSGSSGSRPRLPQLDNINGRGTKGILKKTVSFDMGSTNRLSDEDLYGSPSNPPIRETSCSTPSATELGYIRGTPDRRRNRETDEDTPTGNLAGHNGEAVIGNEVALVQQPAEDKSRGSYWMVPSAAKLRSLPTDQKKKLIGLTVGRRGYGEVRFEHPVDLTQIDLDFEQIPGIIVTFEPRVCTVYPEGLEKPPPGKGLNVPAQITLEDCFPMTKNERGKIRDPEHPRYITHIRRLKNIKDTEFVNYLAEEGIWIFKVMHFTTYGLTEDDDEEEGDVTYDEELTPRGVQYSDEDSMDADVSGVSGSEFDDTFDFKKLNSSTHSRPLQRDPFPGSFLGEEEEDTMDQYSEEDDSQIVDGDVTLNGESFLDEGSVGSEEEDEEPAEPLEESNMLEYSTMILDENEDMDEEGGGDTIGSIEANKATTYHSPTKISTSKGVSATPKVLPMGKDWTEQLTNTISPVKRRYGGENFFSVNDKVDSPAKKNVIEPLNYGLLDLHADLYGSPARSTGGLRSTMRKTRKREQIESPVGSVSRPEGVRPTTKPSSSAKFSSHEKFNYQSLEDVDQQWRKAVRPVWNRDGTLVYMGHLEGLNDNRRGEDCLRIVKLDYGIKDYCSPRSLQHQLDGSEIELKNGVPYAKPKTSILLSTYAELAWSQDPKEQYEKNIWKLGSALWDKINGIPYTNDPLNEAYLFAKVRKENVSQLLQELVDADVDVSIQNANTAEEVAVAHLTAHRIEQACAVLIEAGDLKLGTLLSMIGGSKTLREQIHTQIEQWRKRGVLAEVSVPIRALYELIAGETCYSEGVAKPIEDAAPEFWFAEHFKLDWKRVFGLKLWYGTMEHEDIGDAVQAYDADVEAHPTKLTTPRPWYNPSDSKNIDILWGLLKLYSDSRMPLDAVFAPQNFLSDNPLDRRLPWQLRTILASRGTNDFADSEMLDGPTPVFAAGPTAQKLTTDFAEALEAAGDWHWAIFVTMHLNDSTRRAASIRDILARHIDSEENEEATKLAWLTTTLLVPNKWIEEAKALRARHAGLHIAEAEHLLTAGQFNEAHKTVVTQVAPVGVISGDLAPLRTILARFDINAVDSWGLGGQVYVDYIRLLELDRAGILGQGRHAQEKKQVTQRLLAALKGVEKRGFLQNVAVTEMAGFVAGVVLKGDTESTQDKARVLELPLGEDHYLKKSVNLSLKYFQARLALPAR